MTRKRLLIISYHFPPSAASASFRLLGFARHLPRHGWDCDVVAPPLAPGEATDEGLSARIPSGTVVHPVPYPGGFALRQARRIAGRTVWLPFAGPVCRRLAASGRYDAVLTSGPPHCVHLLGLDLKRRAGLPWLADFRDPWTGFGDAAWLPKAKRPGDRWAARREPEIISEADAILANAPLVAEAFRASFPHAAERIVTLTNGFDPEDFVGLRRLAPPTDPHTIVHAGDVYAGRDPRPVLRALLLMRSEPDGARYLLRLLGSIEGDTAARLREDSALGAGADAELTGQVPYARVQAEMAAASVLLLLDSPGRRHGVPAKLFEYIGAARPILALAESDGDTAWALRQSRVAHRIIDVPRPERIAAAIRELSRMPVPDPRLRAEGRPNAFDRAVLAAGLAETLNMTTRSKPMDASRE